MTITATIFFDTWDSLIRTFTVTVMAYITLIILLRISGKRTLSKMNAFDFIVTIALGSALASASLDKNTALADAVLAFGLLIFLQFTVTWLSVRLKPLKAIVTSKPTLLLYKGEILDKAMRSERITIEEVYAAARAKGCTSLSELDAIILETTGKIIVLKRLNDQNNRAMEDVNGFKNWKNGPVTPG